MHLHYDLMAHKVVVVAGRLQSFSRKEAHDVSPSAHLQRRSELTPAASRDRARHPQSGLPRWRFSVQRAKPLVEKFASQLSMDAYFARANNGRWHMAWLTRLPVCGHTNHPLNPMFHTLMAIEVDWNGLRSDSARPTCADWAVSRSLGSRQKFGRRRPSRYSAWSPRSWKNGLC